MKYIVCQEPGNFMLKEKAIPIPQPGEALVKITRVGICGTDLHAYGGNQAFFTYPRILGHELAGEIVSIETNSKGLIAGDPVVIMPYLNCGQCVACRQGKTNCCSRLDVLGVHIDGGMQEYLTLPIDVLLPAQGLSPQEIALIEPLAIGAHAVRRAEIKPGDVALVMGCGPIGIGLMRFAQLAGARVIALDVNADRLRYVQEQLDISDTLLAQEDPLEALASFTNGELAQVVFDATGNPRALMSGPAYMAHGGSFVLVGLYKGDLSYHHPSLHAKEASILCSRNATLADFAHVMNTLVKKQFPVESYITHRVRFEDMIDHFDSWLKPETGVIKAMVEWG